MKMHTSPHPGEIIRELCLEPLNLTISTAAEALGVSRKTLSAILNGHAGISPEMAVRLSIAFRVPLIILSTTDWALRFVLTRRKSHVIASYCEDLQHRQRGYERSRCVLTNI